MDGTTHTAVSPGISNKRTRRSCASDRQERETPPSSEAATVDENLAQGSTLSQRLVRAFFEQQDSAGRIFLHKSRVLTALHGNQLDALLHKALCAFGALVANDANLSLLSQQLSMEVEQSILSDLYTCTLPRLQALTVLLHLLRAKSSREALWMLLPIASRMAFTLRLNQENTNNSPCAKESQRRLMWSIYLLDAIVSSGADSMAVCPPHQIALQLPSSEHYFSLGMETDLGSLIIGTPGSGQPGMGELSYIVRLMPIRQDILRYVRPSNDMELRVY